MNHKIANTFFLLILFPLFLSLKIDNVHHSTECNSSIGLLTPIPTCSPVNICKNPLITYRLQGRKKIIESSDIPNCKTKWKITKKNFVGCIQGGRGVFDDGKAKLWKDPYGINRYWCEFRPNQVLENSKRPLVIYVPGSGGSADNIYDFTLLRKKAVDFDLTGDTKRKGFILVSVQGRNLHWPTDDAQDGSKHDSYHRNLATNPDVVFFDYLIDYFVNDLKIADPGQIYITGWSNGARFASFYGINRNTVATSGGNKVTAVAVYSGGDPFENTSPNQIPSCKQDTYPQSNLFYLLISRDCDLIACNQQQFDLFKQSGWHMTPGNQATTWINDLKYKMKNNNTSWLIIDSNGQRKNKCLGHTQCNKKNALKNHFCWPDGISDESGIDYEIELLNFLKKNQLR